MSAVLIALDTPLYAIAGKDSVLIHDIPPGDYKLHVWIEGVPQSFLDGLSCPMHFSNHAVDSESWILERDASGETYHCLMNESERHSL